MIWTACAVVARSCSNADLRRYRLAQAIAYAYRSANVGRSLSARVFTTLGEGPSADRWGRTEPWRGKGKPASFQSPVWGDGTARLLGTGVRKTLGQQSQPVKREEAAPAASSSPVLDLAAKGRRGP